MDCNNFYASCERAFNPSLEGKPVIVLSNNDGCIIARSSEAKALGIPMGQPYFKAKKIVEKNNIKVFSSNYTLYGDMSARVMATLGEFIEARDIEIYSIDEAFINIGNYPNPEELARKIRESVYKWTGIPVSIGIGKTKTLAKLANLVSKKYKSYGGVFNIDSNQRRIKVLQAMAPTDIWGIGRINSEKLSSHGIKTAFDLTMKQDQWIRKILTVKGLETVHELRGISCISINSDSDDRKSIVVSRSFGQSIYNYVAIREALSNFAERAAIKLRQSEMLARHATIFLYHKVSPSRDFGLDKSITVDFDYPTDSTGEIISTACNALNYLFHEQTGYKKCGIMLNGFIRKDSFVKDLFDPRDLQRQDALSRSMDQLNNIMGNGTIAYASSNGSGKWIAKKDSKSPCYTTRWKELPVAY